MIPEKSPDHAQQTDLFAPLLRDMIDPAHPLVLLAHEIDWAHFEEVLDPLFCPDNGRPAKPTRLMVGLHYLKYTHDLSDEGLLAAWVENPYWQYFCGEIHFRHRPPIDSSSLTVWRGRLREADLEELLAETIRAGLRAKLIRPRELECVNVDTTVQPKAIRFPTDARLYNRMRERLVAVAQREGVELRQSYVRVGPRALRRQSGYARAKQFKRARRETRKLKTLLGRTVRDIERKRPSPSPELTSLLLLAHRLLQQTRTSKNKVYSVHEPEVACLAKGKPHKRYEFGSKVGYVVSARRNWMIGALAFVGSPHDGKTLGANLDQAERISGRRLRQATVDLGYRGHGVEDRRILVADRFRRQVSPAVRRWWRRRSAIEPVIGHLKAEHRLERNRLKGLAGDRMNAISAACGFNLRKLLGLLDGRRARAFLRLFSRLLELLLPRPPRPTRLCPTT